MRGAPAALLLACISCDAWAAPPATTRLVATGFTEPLDLRALPGRPDAMVVLERSGLLRVFDVETGVVRDPPFLDVSGLVSGTPGGGALGLAFAPDYEQSGHFYVLYFDSADPGCAVTRFTASADPFVADPASATPVLRYDRPYPGHSGGWLAFGPDGMLYVSCGDSGDYLNKDPLNTAQTLVNEKRGKILRVDPSGDDFPADADLNYAIPADNPLVGVEGDDEIWACGLRNPWRGCFDPATGDAYIADVGHDSRDEINFVAAGSSGLKNFGWRCMEGTLCTGLSGCACGDASLIPPVLDIVHADDPCDSVTGGVVYRGSAIPAFQGRYFFADFCSDRVRSFVITGQSADDLQDHTAELALGSDGPARSIATFGVDSAGEMYLVDHNAGSVHKVVPRCPSDFNGDSYVNGDDFDAFVSLFVLGDLAADIDGNTFVNGDDFDLFTDAFVAGC